MTQPSKLFTWASPSSRWLFLKQKQMPSNRSWRHSSLSWQTQLQANFHLGSWQVSRRWSSMRSCWSNSWRSRGSLAWCSTKEKLRCVWKSCLTSTLKTLLQPAMSSSKTTCHTSKESDQSWVSTPPSWSWTISQRTTPQKLRKFFKIP